MKRAKLVIVMLALSSSALFSGVAGASSLDSWAAGGGASFDSALAGAASAYVQIVASGGSPSMPSVPYAQVTVRGAVGASLEAAVAQLGTPEGSGWFEGVAEGMRGSLVIVAVVFATGLIGTPSTTTPVTVPAASTTVPPVVNPVPQPVPTSTGGTGTVVTPISTSTSTSTAPPTTTTTTTTAPVVKTPAPGKHQKPSRVVRSALDRGAVGVVNSNSLLMMSGGFCVGLVVFGLGVLLFRIRRRQV